MQNSSQVEMESLLDKIITDSILPCKYHETILKQMKLTIPLDVTN
jgi:hypothetical protein